MIDTVQNNFITLLNWNSNFSCFSGANDTNSDINSEASFEMSSTAIEIESSVDSEHHPDISTPQLSQDDETNLQEDFMSIGLSPVKKPLSQIVSSEEETDYIDIDC